MAVISVDFCFTIEAFVQNVNSLKLIANLFIPSPLGLGKGLAGAMECLKILIISYLNFLENDNFQIIFFIYHFDDFPQIREA